MYSESIKKVIDDFDLHLYPYNGRYIGCCPIHDGDNIQAFNINVETGRWFCNTKKCHETTGNTFRAFVRMLLSNGDDLCSWDDVNNYLDNNNFEIPEHSSTHTHQEIKKISVELDIDLSYLDNYDLGNCAYFLNRGFTYETLKMHGVFTCPDKTKKLYNLCIVPIFNIVKTKIIAITARMPWNKCIMCGGYHNPQTLCLDLQTIRLSPKWRHEPNGFLKGNHLYNLWNSWRFIKNYKELFIVESPSNCWKLDQCGFHNNVGLLGSTISDFQIELINRLDPNKIFVIGDNDDAGAKLVESISDTFHRVNSIEIKNYNDISEMNDNEVKKLIWDNINK